ncbi:MULTISPECIES: type II secretion system protein N [unclassified Pseudoxanthomonas]|uniref:type II secretion system protein N n=1 Tax=unclassified Pseudoxanthomonas TaxID=2645906 RepID=UPI001319E217|nr:MULTISPECIES: type II secretion system protein N [unclassified Pseudoxanthomonas]
MPRPLPNSLLRHWPALAEAALVLVLLLQLARLLWLAFAPAPASAGAAPVAVAAEAPALAGLDPFFGNAPEAAGEAGSWRLFGLRVAADGGSAILARDGGPQQAYRVGDALAPGVVLEAVAADHAVLLDAGVRRRLELPAVQGAGPGGGPAPAALPASAPAPAPAALPAPAPATAAAPEQETRDVDPARLLAEAGLRTYQEAGRVAGYTLMPRGDAALLRAAGLQPGDVLLSVNGQALDPEHLPEVAEQLKSNPRAVIAYRRDGQVRTVTLGTGSP